MTYEETYEEVIKNIDSILNSTIRHDETLDCDRLGSYDFEWLQLAKKALEKQIPMKPIEKDSVEPMYDDGSIIGAIYSYEAKCPICGRLLASEELERNDCRNIKYCDSCGQAIDLSEVTERVVKDIGKYMTNLLRNSLWQYINVGRRA